MIVFAGRFHLVGLDVTTVRAHEGAVVAAIESLDRKLSGQKRQGRWGGGGWWGGGSRGAPPRPVRSRRATTTPTRNQNPAAWEAARTAMA